MKPEEKSQQLLNITRSKAKMYEYRVPDNYHIKITRDPAKLFSIAIAILGDYVADVNQNRIKTSLVEEFRTNLNFSASFFDSYIQAKLSDPIDPYIVLLGSASYYLCNLPGSSLVMSKLHMNFRDDDLCDLEDLLLWLLKNDLKLHSRKSKGFLGESSKRIKEAFLHFIKSGTGEENLLNLASVIRNTAYKYGTPKQLLLGDIVMAILKQKLHNSAWKSLPLYSGLSSDEWKFAVTKNSFIKEFWPAQHILGKAQVLRGQSAVIQMPTGTGKTKSVELIFRSAFLANRVSIGIIVAPFRALCHEIKNNLSDAFKNEPVKVNELSDTLQTDFNIDELLKHKQIVIVTPEKLFYVIRHVPELTAKIGLIIFDEGHQFDNGSRGIAYELLLTSLRSMIPNTSQKVLISAVISNAKAVGEWLNSESNVVNGSSLIQSYRTIGFVSWLDQLGRIEYVDSDNPDKNVFFVPRVIKKIKQKKIGRESKERYFPEKEDAKSIAFYLGLKLVPQGSIAIFCGKKTTAVSICKKIVDIIERGIPYKLPYEFSDKREIERLYYLYIKNLGDESPTSVCAKYGILSHHGKTPFGIRIAVEHSMRKNLIKFIVCTSTLAQGVNLPIRYLIITDIYQGRESIKVRDFHNLIGRVGRAGIHTEGSILFADPSIYDKRKEVKDKRRWGRIKSLLKPDNTEPCISNLLSIFDPLKSDDQRNTIPINTLRFVKIYVKDPDKVQNFINKLSCKYEQKGFKKASLFQQSTWKINLICAIESFLLSYWDKKIISFSKEDVEQLAKETLAFFLADEENKNNILNLFLILANNISDKIPDPLRRRIFGKSLYGVKDALDIEFWMKENIGHLLKDLDEAEILEIVWSLFTKHINNNIFKKFDKPYVCKEIALNWINGVPFIDLLNIIHKHEAKIQYGKRSQEFKIEDVVEFCEIALSYEGSLLISALSDFLELFYLNENVRLVSQLQLFQKRLKYGLPTRSSIALYEMGFSDRVVAQDLAGVLQSTTYEKESLVFVMQHSPQIVLETLDKYPKYFHEVFKRYG